MSIRSALVASLAASALLASGCGDTCPTETPARVEAIGSCTAAPGGTVSVPVRLCPTCNQTGATCEVDTSQASTGFIQLDPIVEACEAVTSCAAPTPTCQANPLTCTLRAPAAEGDYTLLVFDQSRNRSIQGTLTVSSTSSASCSLALAAE
jgi:hypothetical protein